MKPEPEAGKDQPSCDSGSYERNWMTFANAPVPSVRKGDTLSQSDTFLLHFSPNTWLPEDRFAQFLGPPFKVDFRLRHGTAATRSHFRKYELLVQIAVDIQPLLERDEQELRDKGHTPALNGAKFAALIETMLGELYAVLDGVRQVIFSVYRRIRCVQDESNQALFERAAKGAYGSAFPEELRALLADGFLTWFPKLRTIRSENTHGDIGTCFLDKISKRIKYLHQSVKDDAGHPLIIDDIVEYCNMTYASIRHLASWLFTDLYRQLEPRERKITCGTYRMHFFERMVAPSESLSFSDGRCLSVNWFSTKPELACPLRDGCAAYSRPVPKDEYTRIFGA